VQFPGYIHHDKELPSYFQRATIFTSPSLFQEPFGLVNAEAMACGTAVVGSSRGGIPEVLGDAGVLIDPKDSIGFAAALMHVLAHPELRAEMGRAGVNRARETFDWKVIAEDWAALLDDLSAPRSREINLDGSGERVVS